MEFNRSMDLVNPYKIKNNFLVIGCGAVGGEVASQLVNLGVANECNDSRLELYDGDSVKEHNLPNQPYFQKSIGSNKANALFDILKSKGDSITSVSAFPYNLDKEKVDVKENTVCFLLTDSMESRKEIFERVIKNNLNLDLMIETRMGLRHGMVYAIDPKSLNEIKLWEDTLFSDEEDGDVTACGTSRTCGTTAKLISTLAVGMWVEYQEAGNLKYNEIQILEQYPPRFYFASFKSRENVVF